jgi:hypothetical protein
MAKRKPRVHGEYSAESYTIFVNGQPAYTGGNYPLESQTFVPADEGVGLEKMKEFCESTAREIAEEKGGEFVGVEEAETEDDGDDGEVDETPATPFEQAVEQTARSLWLLSYWDDDRMRAYREVTGRSPIQTYGQQMESWPAPPVDHGVVFQVKRLVERIQVAWGWTFTDVAARMGEPLHRVMYYTVMACIGHGVGPNDDGKFPEGLDESPVRAEDPAADNVPVLGDWSGVLRVRVTTDRYAPALSEGAVGVPLSVDGARVDVEFSGGRQYVFTSMSEWEWTEEAYEPDELD